MSNRQGLRKVVKTVRGKKGTVRRSYWVKSNPKVAAPRQAKGPGFLSQHGGKLLAAIPTALTAASMAGKAWKHREAAVSAFKMARHDFSGFRKGTGGDLAHHLLNAGGEHLTGHVGGAVGGRLGMALGGAIGGAPGAALGSFVGGHAGGFLAGRYGGSHVARGAKMLADRLRR